MTQARKAAGTRKGPAARAEKTPEPRTLEWRGITLTLPAIMPALSIASAWRDLEDASEQENGLAVRMHLDEIIDIVVGGNRTLRKAVVRKIDAEDDDDVSAVLELATEALGAYGVEPGESAASPSP